MINKNVTKIIPFKFLFFISLLTITYSETVKSIPKDIIKREALKHGYDLTNPDNQFFSDICIQFTYDDKDLTLEYKQKYFFFPKNSDTNIQFHPPKRNNTLSCFFDALKIKNIYYNISFIILFPLVFIQCTFLLLIIIMKPEVVFSNSSYRQLEIIQKGKNTPSRFKNHFSEFIGENDIYNETQQKFFDEGSFETKTNYKIKINQVEQQKNNDKKEDENDHIESTDSKKNYIDNLNKNNNTESNKEEVNGNYNTIEDTVKANLNIDKESKNKFAEQIKNFKSCYSLGNLDNYTFGNDINQFKGNEENNNNKEQKNENENKESIQKRMEQFYNLVNQKKFVEIKNNNIIKNENSSQQNLKEEFQYSREEYFYFGYPLARIQDKRNIFQIYLDLLNQCQIIFKFFCIPFNIFEDRLLQIVYYIFKINLYFLLNIILTGNNVINKIFDNKNTFKDDIYRSFLSSCFTYLIGLFIYHLTNIKKTLIKRRYKLLNLRLTNQIIVSEFSKMSYMFCMDYFLNKLQILLVILICFSFGMLYICISYCFVYNNTQIYILKLVIYSCIISQLSPFILCWIPSYLRKLSLNKKSIRLYLFAKFVESFYAP